MIIIGLDPGSKNFAYSVIEISDFSSPTFSVIKTGFVITPVNLFDLNITQTKLADIAETFQPDFIVTERFMFRGVQSKSAEITNLLIGLVYSLTELRNIPLFLVPPAQWKSFYKNEKNKVKLPLEAVSTPHETDATNMAVWYHRHGIHFHGEKLLEYYQTKRPKYECKNCRFWEWEDSKRKTNIPCSKLKLKIEENDYCGEFQPLTIYEKVIIKECHKPILQYFIFNTIARIFIKESIEYEYFIDFKNSEKNYIYDKKNKIRISFNFFDLKPTEKVLKEVVLDYHTFNIKAKKLKEVYENEVKHK